MFYAKIVIEDAGFNIKEVLASEQDYASGKLFITAI